MSEGDLAVSREVKSGFGLFKKLTFCFPLLDSELTPKRTELIGKTI